MSGFLCDIAVVFTVWWSYHGCSHGVCLFIHQGFVKWDKFSSVILVVERQNKEDEFIEKEDLWAWKRIRPESVGWFCLFKCTNVRLWSAMTGVCAEECMLALSSDFPCSIWLFTLWNQNGGSDFQAAYRVAIVTCCWFQVSMLRKTGRFSRGLAGCQWRFASRFEMGCLSFPFM